MNFIVYGIDNVPDLYGNIIDPQLVVFFAGNQFSVSGMYISYRVQVPNTLGSRKC